MKKILVAVDGSVEAQRAARMAADIAVRFGASLTMMHVIPPLLVPPETTTGFDFASYEAEREAAAARLLQETETRLEEPGLVVEHLVSHGAPAELLAEEAQRRKVDLLVAGHRGRGAVARVLLGSVASRLAHICEQPLLIVR